jgi:hypothetical protein
VAAAGDINGDGLADVVVGAPRAEPGDVFVFSGASGAVARVLGTPGTQDMFGWSAASAGDVNQDGVPDIIVGAPNASPRGVEDGGSAFVFSGADGSLLWRFDGEASSHPGRSVASAGDLNGDGVPDILVGAPWAYPGGLTSAGSVFVYSGADGSLLRRFDGSSRSNLGDSVAGPGDVNGDGVPDVISSAADPPPPPGGSYTSVALIFDGASGDLVRRLDNLGPGRCSVAGAGDVNGDGLADVVVGVPYASPGGRYAAGSAWVLTPVGPSIVINPPPIPGGAIATNNPAVNLLLPVVGAATMEFAEPGGNWIGPYPYSPRGKYVFSRAEGIRRLYVRYRDPSGNVMAETFDDIALSFSGPVVSIMSPASGAVVRGIVTVKAEAVAPLSTVASVMLIVDGSPLGTDTAAPYEWKWDTRPAAVAPGPHTLVARVLDNAGNAREATITVTVDKTITFADVSISDPFWQYIEALFSAGVTGGCKSSPRLFCPNRNLTRGEMAKLICKAAGKTWLDRPTPTFTDVPKTHLFYGWIERVTDAASWGGYPPVWLNEDPTRYFPADSVTRGGLARILCVATGRSPLFRTVPTFSDVMPDYDSYG